MWSRLWFWRAAETVTVLTERPHTIGTDSGLKAILLSGTCALMVSLFITRWAISQFASWGLGQLIRDDGPRTHHEKRGTPTMGGAAIVVSVVIGYAAAKLVTWDLPSRSAVLVLFSWWACHAATTTSSPPSCAAISRSGGQPPASSWTTARSPDQCLTTTARRRTTATDSHDQRPLRRCPQGLERPHRRVRRQAGRADRRAGQVPRPARPQGHRRRAHARLAAARKPLPADRATAALAYRVKDLTTLKSPRWDVPVDRHIRRAPQQQGGRSLGM